MVPKEVSEIIGIEATNAADLGEKATKKFRELAENPSVKNVRWEFNKEAGHCIYIYFCRLTYLPATAEERYEARGERYYCIDCPFYHKSDDKRVVYTICGHGRRRTSAKSCACSEFYEMLERGEIEEGVSE